jgi:hypothetical protein
MTSIDERLLENKMTHIEQARAWSPRVISKFETLIRSGDEVSVYRANPVAFARDRGVAEPESIDLFLHAARAGLFGPMQGPPPARPQTPVEVFTPAMPRTRRRSIPNAAVRLAFPIAAPISTISAAAARSSRPCC